jgi:hypothetical protein
MYAMLRRMVRSFDDQVAAQWLWPCGRGGNSTSMLAIRQPWRRAW